LEIKPSEPSTVQPCYKTQDIAILIPTKDRPKEIERLIQSLVDQDCKIGRVIIVASGKDIQAVVTKFNPWLSVEYYRSEPGQIRQRNLGISILDDSTKLVATMDDDAVFHENSIKEMINFWNNVEPQTAGVGFNIVNQNPHKHNWLRGLLGFSVPEPGKVLKSGNCTSISNVKANISCEWLNGGGTVWRQDILIKYPHTEIKSNWAVCEDLIYSYPKSKIYHLYISKNSKISIEDVAMKRDDVELHRFRGKTFFLWKLYFVLSNKELSTVNLIFYHCIQMVALFIYGLLWNDRNRSALAKGYFSGLVALRKVSFNKDKLKEYIENNT
jgi:glycosyltransferase involved in cell wall biosynthesis